VLIHERRRMHACAPTPTPTPTRARTHTHNCSHTRAHTHAKQEAAGRSMVQGASAKGKPESAAAACPVLQHGAGCAARFG